LTGIKKLLIKTPFKKEVNSLNVSTLFKISRGKAQLNQKDMADRLGITANNLSKYETGAVTPPGDIVYTLLSVLKEMEISLDELFSETQLAEKKELNPEDIEKLDFKPYQKIENTMIAIIDQPFTVRTNKGLQTGQAGDGLVQGKEGNYYRIPKRVFEKIYKQK